MPLGPCARPSTHPPPFFRQGPSALSKLVFFSGAGGLPDGGRHALQIWTQPLRATRRGAAACSARWPCRWRCEGGEDGLRGLRPPCRRTRGRRPAWRLQAERCGPTVEQLQQENTRLRALLELREAVARAFAPGRGAVRGGRSVFAQGHHRPRCHAGVVRLARHRRSRRAGPGDPPVPADMSEVTLLADRDAAIPVLNTRTQQRNVAFGGAAGGMELRYASANADVKEGDELTTSGRRRRLPARPAGGARGKPSSGGWSRVSRACCCTPVAQALACATCWCWSLEGWPRSLPPRPEPPPPRRPRPATS
jgi:rod shape-determining protein MreC